MNEGEDERSGWTGMETGGDSAGLTEEFSAPGSPAPMSGRERRRIEREQRKLRHEAAKQRRVALREEAKRRRVDGPTPEAGPEPEGFAELEAEGEAATGDPDPDEFQPGFAQAVGDDQPDAGLSRRERRELRKKQQAAEREAARAERQAAQAEYRRGHDEGDLDGNEELDEQGDAADPPSYEEDQESSPELEGGTADQPEPEPEPEPLSEPEAAADADPAERIEAAGQREEEARIEATEQEANAAVDRRVREMRGIERLAEHGAAEAGMTELSADPDGEPTAPFAEELRATEEHIERRRGRDQELISELDATEVRIGEVRERTQQAIDEAQRRLEEIQAQATEAEERASRAEQIAELKQAEAEREHRLLEMLEKINEAERRAREAEARARQAVANVARPFEPLKAPSPLPVDAPESIEDLKSRPYEADFAALEEIEEQLDPEAPVDLNEASFEQLRAVGLSVTQVGRLLAVRERRGGFQSVDEIDSIPGFPREFLDTVKGRLQV